MTRAKAMQIVEKLLKKDFKYLCKECRLKIYTLHLSFLMDSQTHNLQANLDFQENWVDVLCFISPTELTVGSENYWQALQTVNYVNWYTKAAGRFYIDTYGDIHICEVCGKREVLTPQEGYQKGWDYAPYMYPFKVISPRTCNECTIEKTVYWQVAVLHKIFSDLTEEQKETIKRIYIEPDSILANK